MKARTFLVACCLALGGICVPVHAQEEGNFVSEDVMQHLQEGDKIALLMVHFGTTHDNTRALTIDALNQKAKAEFPQRSSAKPILRASSCGGWPSGACAN